LIRYILNSPDHGKRIAVIENEFGDDGGLAIESIIARDGVDGQNLIDLIELPNGCVCCTVKDSLVATLEALLDKRQDLDYIIIECSGMANPGPVATIFWLDDALDSRLRLDGIVTLCDARHIQEQFATTLEAAQQVAYADRILLNKIDLIAPDDNDNDDADVSSSTGDIIDGIVQSIRRFHPTVPIRPTTFAACDLDWILDARCFDADRIQAVEDSFANVSDRSVLRRPPFLIKNGHDHNQQDLTCGICDSSADVATFRTPLSALHEHTKAISTISLFLQGTVDLRKIDRWLASILWPNQDEHDNVLRELIKRGGRGDGDEDEDPTTTAKSANTAGGQHQGMAPKEDTMSIFRIKGILSVLIGKDSADYSPDYVDSNTGIDRRRYIVQGVHDLWEIHPTTGKDMEWSHNNSANGGEEEEEEDRSCRLVVIGRSLDEERLRNGFYSCRVG
jgi:G3E family GTPase